VLDKTGMKGTGRWTIQEAAERNVPATTIAAALDARYLRSVCCWLGWFCFFVVVVFF
jgi:6-phosphogluconate dehydrogenase